MKRQENIQVYKKPLNLNIGIIIFTVILIYIIICICMYFSQKHIYGYEVKTGSLSVSNIYEGFAIRDEEIVTSTEAGYINYFAREGERIGSNKLVCTIDETGQIKEMMSDSKNEESLLNDQNFSEIRTEIENYINSFDRKSFSSTYDFKFAVKGNILKYSSTNLLNSIGEIYQGSTESINICNAPKSGIVVYSTDGYEKVTPGDVNESWFQHDKYQKTQLVNNNIIAKGDHIYKLSTNENWSIIIPIEEDRAQELIEEEYVKIKFLKNQTESWAKVSAIQGTDNKSYIQLSLNNSMLSFVTDRFIDIELYTDVETGLKVPNSAIIEKEFFLVPEEYIFKGGKHGNAGVLRQSYNEDGSSVPEFVEVSIYNEENGEYYIDDSVLRVGDVLSKENSTETFTVSKVGTLIGVYNINKGYADFKQIQILNENEEYSIIKSNTNYGLVAYDYIVLDADSVDNDELIYD